MTRRDAATERQVQAADPQMSTWLSANAGSGKTRVLTDRVARLLLDSVSPQHILCLTYTKAAASEMQNRLFNRLGEWAMLPSDRLEQQLHELGLDRSIGKTELRRARTLFARAIETPGGLKIQTIHSFCASILRRFPLEAGVSPQFIEMDDRAAKQLRNDIVEEMAAGDKVDAVDALVAYFTDGDLSKLTEEIVKNSASLPAEKEDIWKLFEIGPDVTPQSILSSFAPYDIPALFKVLLPALRAGSPKDLIAYEKLNLLDPSNIRYDDLEVLESVFLYGKSAAHPFGAKTGMFPTKPTQAKLGAMQDRLNDLLLHTERAHKLRISLYSAEKTWALHRFAAEFLPIYNERKLLRGWLDFDDLINVTARLLGNPLVAQWVLYRLDGGIEHILVDEAQDTSPRQWQVIERLTQEFSAGEGAHKDRQRTIFVVGDKKQSIYSFQGADPDEFDRMCTFFERKLNDAGQSLQPLELEYSFRSAEPILRLVDSTFRHRANQGVGEVRHKTNQLDLPGRVDLWPVVEKTETTEDKEWFDPQDMVARNHETVILARQIAQTIHDMCHDKVLIPEQDRENGLIMRPVQEGDFLILVQRRSPLFHEIIRACKSLGLSIAGADRLKIGGELAVRDLTALLSFLATPEDDLSLASALRSPLFGWSEQDLFNLAYHRPEKTFLWSQLRQVRDTYSETIDILESLRNDADFLRPYELLERILTRYDGRRKLLARLGEEAEDGIDALLAQAMSFEQMEVPSLTGFITWLQAEEVEIKRQMDSSGNRIRVMTVHGAKGLESPIVIMPDTVSVGRPSKDELYKTENGVVIWKTNADTSAQVMTDARNTVRMRDEQERMRLLYVAMTRAEKWLIVCGAGKTDKDGKNWHAMIGEGMKHAGATEMMFPTGPGLRLEGGNWNIGESSSKQHSDHPSDPLPIWAETAANIPERPQQTLSPSGLGGAKALAGEGLEDDEARIRGSRIHLLLEHLPDHPKIQWQDLASKLLPDTAPDELVDVFSEARAVLENPDFSHIFAPDTLAEVPVSATLEELGNRRIHGNIDRLIISDDHILAVDFKSNAIVPQNAKDVPDGILRQMGAYQAALEQIFPNHSVSTAILWTRDCSLMPLEQTIVTAALRTTALP